MNRYTVGFIRCRNWCLPAANIVTWLHTGHLQNFERAYQFTKSYFLKIAALVIVIFP